MYLAVTAIKNQINLYTVFEKRHLRTNSLDSLTCIRGWTGSVYTCKDKIGHGEDRLFLMNVTSTRGFRLLTWMWTKRNVHLEVNVVNVILNLGCRDPTGVEQTSNPRSHFLRIVHSCADCHFK